MEDEGVSEKLDMLIAEFRAHKALIESGFPRDDLGNIDFHGHRGYHNAVIQRAAELESRKTRIIDKAISGGVMSAIAFVAYAAWHRVVDFIMGAGPK